VGGSLSHATTVREWSTPDGTLLAVYPDPEVLASATADLIVEEARRAAKTRGRFTVALAGGSTPALTYSLLGRSPLAGIMPWEQSHFFWTDERCVDPGDPRSNERMARDAFLASVPVPPANIHPMTCAKEGLSPDGGRSSQADAEEIARRGADEYDRLLGGLFPSTGAAEAPGRAGRAHRAPTALDLVLLGLGEDGHTASLFAGSEVLSEERRSAAAVFVEAAVNTGTSAGSHDLWRITLTAAFINRTALVVFVAGGRSKAAIVRQVVEGPVDGPDLPARLIRPARGALRWHLDEDAAELLTAGLEGH